VTQGATGAWIAPPFYSPSGGTVINSATITTLMPFFLPFACHIDQLGLKQSTAGGAGSVCQFGLYASKATNGYPTGTALANSSASPTATTGTTTVSGALSSSVAIQANTIYWYAQQQDSNSALAVYAGASLGASYFLYMIGDATLANLSTTAANNNISMYLTTSQAYGTWGDLTSASFTIQRGAGNAIFPFLHVMVP